MSPELNEYTKQAIAQWRAEHPDDDDLPDEVVAKLVPVSVTAFGLALRQLGKDIADDAALRSLRRWLRDRAARDVEEGQA